MAAPYDESTAYHEAGHAVLALALGRPVHSVSIVPQQERLGQCEYRKGTFRPSEDWLEREILIALGGIAAEARLLGTFVREMAASDLRYVHDLAAQRVGRQRADRLERRLLAKAEHLLSQERQWRAVELIAAELMRRGTISGRAARHLYEQSADAR